MTEQERQHVIELLEQTRDDFLDLTQDLSQAQWTTLPEPGAWSVALVAEHLVSSEIMVGRLIQGVLASESDPDWEEKTAGQIEVLKRIMPMRSRKATAPEIVLPKGKIPVPDLRSRFRKARQRTLDFVSSVDQPIKQHLGPHPFFGLLNGYQWLVSIPLHNLRHNLQIVEALEKISRQDAKTQGRPQS